MFYPTKATAAFAILSFFGFASASCFSSGIVADAATMDAAREDAQLETMCSFLIGEYALHEQRYTCIEIGGNKYDLRLKYDAQPEVAFDHYTHDPAPTRKIDSAECKDGMKKELGCSRGGESMYTNWRYKADYNLGKCTQPFRRGAEPEAKPVRRDHSRAFTA